MRNTSTEIQLHAMCPVRMKHTGHAAKVVYNAVSEITSIFIGRLY